MTLLNKLTKGVEENDSVEGSVRQLLKNMAMEGRAAYDSGDEEYDEFWEEIERSESNLGAAVAANTHREDAPAPGLSRPGAALLHPETKVVGDPLLAEPFVVAEPSEAALRQVMPQPQPPPGPEPAHTVAPRSGAPGPVPTAAQPAPHAKAATAPKEPPPAHQPQRSSSPKGKGR